MAADPKSLVKSLELLRKVVSQKIALDERGFGCCPFHEEKTSSFHVFLASSGRARYHCFGCGAQGDIFNYLRHTDRLGFQAATAHLLKMLESSGDDSAATSSLAFLSPEGGQHSPPSTVLPSIFCERDCQKYANLREDYEHILEENQKLRGGPAPGPSNESSDSDYAARAFEASHTALIQEIYQAILPELKNYDVELLKAIQRRLLGLMRA